MRRPRNGSDQLHLHQERLGKRRGEGSTTAKTQELGPSKAGSVGNRVGNRVGCEGAAGRRQDSQAAGGKRGVQGGKA